MKDVVFWGATGQAKVLFEAISGIGINLVALIDNRPIPSPIAGLPVFSDTNGFHKWMLQQDRKLNIHYAIERIASVLCDPLTKWV
jgi:hypothetical protein